jgi:hypothetical protein
MGRLRRRVLRALTEGILVNQVLRNFLESYAGVSAEQAAALNDLMDLSRRTESQHPDAKPGPARSFMSAANAPVL